MTKPIVKNDSVGAGTGERIEKISGVAKSRRAKWLFSVAQLYIQQLAELYDSALAANEKTPSLSFEQASWLTSEVFRLRDQFQKLEVSDQDAIEKIIMEYGAILRGEDASI
jgi:hypothetical protein